MKTPLIIVIVAAAFITAASCKSKAQKDAEDFKNKIEETVKENSLAKTDEGQKAGGTASIPQGLEDIVGEWEMQSSIVDTNDNLQIDEEERKNLKPTAFKDYMKLNKDGTGLFTIGKMEGRYEIKEESNGRKFMTWYDKANGPHRVGSIMKVTKDELTIKEPGGYGLFLWKRL